MSFTREEQFNQIKENVNQFRDSMKKLSLKDAMKTMEKSIIAFVKEKGPANPVGFNMRDYKVGMGYLNIYIEELQNEKEFTDEELFQRISDLLEDN